MSTIVNNFKNVLVVGATGWLGGNFVDALLEAPFHFNVRLLVRTSTLADEKKRVRVDGWVSRGTTVAAGDVNSPQELQNALQGIDLVVSVLSRQSIIDGVELRLVQAAHSAGVKRFIPSQYGHDIRFYKAGSGMPYLDKKLEVLQELKRLNVEFVVVFTNGWMDLTLGTHHLGFDAIRGDTVIVPNNSDTPVSLTLCSDVPRLSIPALIHPSTGNSFVTVAANNLTWNQVVETAEKVLGKKLKRKYLTAQQILQIREEDPDEYSKHGLYYTARFAEDPAAADFSKTAFNVIHPELYTHVRPVSVSEFFAAAAAKK